MSTKWDKRFLRLAREVSSWSKDPSTKVGAIIVDSDRQVVSMGYNGFPYCFDDCEKSYLDRSIKLDRIIHGEMNAVMNAKRSVRGCTLYTWPFMTCDRCAVHMLQAGIERFVAPMTPPEIEERWSESIQKAKNHIYRAKKQLILYNVGNIDDCRCGFNP